MARPGVADDGTLTHSVLTCPHCGHAEALEMPPYSFQQFHTCSACGVRLKALDGECCVFCSYGDTPCPPEQRGGKSCCGRD